ncbi:bifunctional diguanylate cyclase/phosphodiesterase [Aureibacillus halotolerans]|uniref:PAS domain S-box-containing protein/diguanylate cyclase (GGDEF)-like protein n=1 Tax=Aureibacillus halotolerans TaxID=1508390 RepID=A0A4R6U256_9BACI|nr:bifunctional diguanylate cyclase/phosphodiesterase [Aureibacillus halotolerans]TDQ38783.1 PAS domain S-box-containing protein/diguanylate cyclase (GGDEF)-like protein [Aureibacillus halotolerans]
MLAMTHHYNITLVVLSIAVAVLSSYAALHIGNRLVRSSGFKRHLWLTGGAFTLGFGIWSMHFIAMLAHHTSMHVTYQLFPLILSIVFAILACLVAFYILNYGLQKQSQFLLGSLFISVGIVSMHYVGMAAMVVDGVIHYDPLLVGASVLVAFTASYVALLCMFYFRAGIEKAGGHLRMMISSLVMGLAIAGMHYIGMAGASFKVPLSSTDTPLHSPWLSSQMLAVLTGIVVLVTIAFTFAMIYFDRRMESTSIELQRIDDLYQSIVMTAKDAIVMTDTKGLILSWNASAKSIFGYSEAEALGQPLTLIIPERFHAAHLHAISAPKAAAFSKVIGKTIEMIGCCKDGSEIPIELSVSSFSHNDSDTIYTGIMRDITERLQSQEKIQTLVYRDELTKLPNRRMLQEHLNSLLEQSSPDHPLAIMFIDLDRFKSINDVYGHKTGDRLLKEVAQKLKQCLDSSAMLARLAGDEFVVILTKTTHLHAGQVANQILQTLNERIVIHRNDFYITASIGISLYPEDGKDTATLLKHADIAMYDAKENGKNNYRYFTTEMNESMTKRLDIETGLRKGLEEGHFELHYQPQVSVLDKNIKGVEALIRWRNPESGLIPPNDFIPIAEDTGLILRIDQWVLQEACSQAKLWQDEGSFHGRMSVNISALQFKQRDFPDTVRRTLQDTGLDPTFLELELTESIIQDPEHAFPVMKALKDMGIRLSLDDFGTGYSSLSYLKDFPLDTIKVDKSFIQTMNNGLKDQAIVNSIINIATSLDLTVIAEGVETDDQLLSLQQKHCHEYQGYLFSTPLSSKDFIEKLNRGDFQVLQGIS